jgi:hypothetical protein
VIGKSLITWDLIVLKEQAHFLATDATPEKSYLFAGAILFYRNGVRKLMRTPGEITIDEYNCSQRRELNEIEEQKSF